MANAWSVLRRILTRTFCNLNGRSWTTIWKVLEQLHKWLVDRSQSRVYKYTIGDYWAYTRYTETRRSVVLHEDLRVAVAVPDRRTPFHAQERGVPVTTIITEAGTTECTYAQLQTKRTAYADLLANAKLNQPSPLVWHALVYQPLLIVHDGDEKAEAVLVFYCGHTGPLNSGRSRSGLWRHGNDVLLLSV